MDTAPRGFPCIDVSPDLRPGITFRLQYRVPAEKTVPNIYPEFAEFREMPEVFATGFMVSLIEGACLLAIKPYLDCPREHPTGAEPESQTPVPSPCNSVCRMAPDGAYCVGCFRTLDEIAGWAGFDDARRRLVWRQLR